MDEWEPEWMRMAFTTMLTCDNPICGEVVAVSGRAGVDSLHDYDEVGQPHQFYYNWLKPASMAPAPPLFPIAKNLPEPVKDELKLAFQLYWMDLSASTSRIRTSLERVLDEQGIATTAVDKKGKLRRLDLFDRIDLFEKQSNDADLAESMTAMRIIGNLGTHGDKVKEGDYFDLLDIYEDALSEIYDQKTAKLKAKKQALIALKKK
ncbi:DUF4145 domain-containing protein [Sulfitobacter sp. M39]|uniref:DUF4145 domain-containing protein n=1 Tax=Sulfitobacter sp. M39 TaxID=2675334 RepID=UPI001F29C583|nr:DUF4145 domain-containing protein [Sulfitobacter sp. M39]